MPFTSGAETASARLRLASLCPKNRLKPRYFVFRGRPIDSLEICDNARDLVHQIGGVAFSNADVERRNGDQELLTRGQFRRICPMGVELPTYLRNLRMRESKIVNAMSKDIAYSTNPIQIILRFLVD